MARKAPQLAKLTRPRLHKAVARERLFALLDEKREHPVVWIVGPPGAGKTTLAASYLKETGLPAIWYQIDSGDSDPATFFLYLKQAVEAVARRKAKPLPLLTPEYLSDLPGFARRFMRDAFARLATEVLMVFDNYHEIAPDSALHAAFAAAIAEGPEGANIIVLSRADPPSAFAASIVSQVIAQISWEDLRLTQEEALGIAAVRGMADANVAKDLHRRTDGWIAGLTLMLERSKGGEPIRSAARAETLETVFDYFSQVILEQSSTEARNVMVRTALLAYMTPSLVEAVTGSAGAIRYVDALHRRHLFTSRTPGQVDTYQYHALFHAFLRNRALAGLPESEIRVIRLRAAQCMELDGDREGAFTLYIDSECWMDAERLLVHQAPALIAQGRWQTLQEWVKSLPNSQVDANPWVRYWLGRSKAFVDPSAARPWLEAAYEAFEQRGEQSGQLLCAVSLLETLFFEFKDLRAMDPWAEKVDRFLERGVPFSAHEDELRAHAALVMWAAHRLPQYEKIGTSVRRVERLLSGPVDVNLRVEVATMLLAYANMAMDFEAARVAITEARPLLQSPHLSVLRALYFYGVEGHSHYVHGRYHEALSCFDRADKIALEHGLGRAAYRVIAWRGICERRAGLLDEAEATMRRLEQFPIPPGGVRLGLFNLLRAGILFERGDFDKAIPTILEARRAGESSGHFTGDVLVGMVAANMAVAGGRLDVAADILARVRVKARGPVAGNYLAAIALNDAWLAHRLGDRMRRNELLRESLQRARDPGSRVRFCWHLNALSDLLPVALSEDIEAETARRLANEFDVVPSGMAPENWPWPVKIYTLGRFDLLLDEKPLEFSRKAPKKVLLLLKAIIAFGGREVPEQKLIDALWPDEEGDAASRSLTTTLHRLRRLLGHANAIRQLGGGITLDDKLCWVDSRAFEALLTADEEEVDTALALYRGGFLAGEEGCPWAVPMRERLRAKFIDAVGRIGERLEDAERHEEAISLYQRGIESDNLIEPFYLGLMRCYDQLNRRTEAISIYRRLREILSVTLGITPSATTQRLFEALRQD